MRQSLAKLASKGNLFPGNGYNHLGDEVFCGHRTDHFFHSPLTFQEMTGTNARVACYEKFYNMVGMTGKDNLAYYTYYFESEEDELKFQLTYL